MNDGSSLNLTGEATPRLIDYLWRRRGAKTWWGIAALYWTAFALAKIFPERLGFVDSPPAAYLIVFCFPPLIALALSLPWQREIIKRSPSPKMEGGDQPSALSCSRIFHEQWARDEESWKVSSANPGSTSRRIRDMHRHARQR